MSEVLQELVHLQGRRRLAGELAYTFDAPRAACLLVNPHPYMGGRMDNNIIASLAAALPQAGFATLRFDYSGVGQSEGALIDVSTAMAEFWSAGRTPLDSLMIEDAQVALDWIRTRVDAPVFIIGYSFGAYIATQIAPADAAGVTLISPTIKQHDFQLGFDRRTPMLVVHSDNDFTADLESFKAWMANLSGGCQCRCVSGGEHFFIGLEHRVVDATIDFINGVLSEIGGDG